jgi:ComF family protein
MPRTDHANQLVRRVRAACRGAVGELFPSIRLQELAQAEADGFHIDTPDRYCRHCGASIGPGTSTAHGCPACFGRRFPWRRVVRLAAYQPPVSDWVVAMKFAQQWSWAEWFGAELAEVIAGLEESQRDAGGAGNVRTVVCPVPMHWLHRWRRGYNQAALIAKALARELDLPVADLLRRPERRPPQTRVPVSQRPANVRDAFALRPIDLTGWRVWLVDDVKTTGSTLNACARLLRQAGAQDIRVAVATVADPKGSR